VTQDQQIEQERRDHLRIRDTARRHGFAISVGDARMVWERVSLKRGGTPWMPLPEVESELFTTMLEALHEWLIENDETAPTALAPVGARPILVDEAQDGPCEICARWASRKTTPREGGGNIFHCDECGEAIPNMQDMSGRGIQGIVPHHFHLRLINATVPGRQGIHQELCPDCFMRHRAEVYPGRPLNGEIVVQSQPVPERARTEAKVEVSP
jgi:hypothetical protein